MKEKKRSIPLESDDLKPIRSLHDLFQTAKGFYRSRILLVANRLNLFTILGEAKLGSQEISRRLNSDPRATRILLDALVAMGLLSKFKDVYAVRQLVKRYLSRGSSECKADLLGHYDYMWGNWLHLEEGVMGKPAPRVDLLSDPHINRTFINAMYILHNEQAVRYANLLNLKRVRKMMDLGGGGGSFSIAFTKKNPNLRSIIVDLPNTVRITEKIVKSQRLSSRITFQNVDFFNDSGWFCGDDFDLIFISYVLHCERPEKNRFLLRKAYNSLKPGGQILINDYPLSISRTKPAGSAIFTVNLFLSTEGGNTYTQEEIKSWLEETGFVKVDSLNSYLSTGFKRIDFKPKKY